MADGVTTRVQKEVGLLHKELESFRAEMAATNEQLRRDMDARIETASMETRTMFAQLLRQFETLQGGRGLEGSASTVPSVLPQKSILGTPGDIKDTTQASTELIDLTGSSRVLTKYSKLQCPRFDGMDFRGWLLKIEQFFEVD